MLYSKDRYANFFITKNFENCYIGDANHPELGKKIFLLYHYQMTVEYVKFERKIELMSEYETDYDYSDERRVMYILNIPDMFAGDFQRFLKGEYTQFSEELKSNILEFWNIKDQTNALYIALYGDDKEKSKRLTFDRTEGEFWPKPVLTREIYMNPN